MPSVASSGRATFAAAMGEPHPHLGLYRRATAAALVVGPALFLVDNLLHPKEYTRDHEAEQLAEIGEAYTRWQAAHLLGFLTLLTFAAAVLGLAYLVRRRQPGPGLAGGVLGLAGLLALCGVIALDGFTWGVLGEVSTRRGVDKATVELVLKDVQQSEWALPFYLLGLAWVLGLITLAGSLVRQGAVPLWAGALFGVGALLAGTEGLIVSNAYYVVGSAVLLAGAAAVAAAIWQMGDEDFATGAPALSRPAAGDRSSDSGP